MAGGRIWTPDEIEILRQHYPSASRDEIMLMLPGRNSLAIELKAERIGVLRERFWRQRDIDRLSEVYPTATKGEVLRALDGHRWTAIARKASALGIQRRGKGLTSRYTVNHEFFDVWSPDMAYVFGLWCADGCMLRSNGGYVVTFASNDEDYLELIKTLMGSTHRLTHGPTCSFFTIYSLGLWNGLQRLGGTPRKSTTLTMPVVPGKFMRDFVRGVIDGDGSLGIYNGRPCIQLLGTSGLLSGIVDGINEQTGVPVPPLTLKKDPKRTGDHTFDIKYTGIKAVAVASWLYRPGDSSLDRKHAIARRICRWTPSASGWRNIVGRGMLTPKMIWMLQGM